MSSTSSSDPNTEKLSATESLARRYRHLFLLPSTASLLFGSAAASLLLGVFSRGVGGVFSALVAFLVVILSALAISSAVRIADPRTIATFRRTLAVLLAGDLLWLVCVVVGATFALGLGSKSAVANAVVFGAFACAGLEFLVINGAFVRGAALSLLLAALMPASTLLVLGPQLSVQSDLIPGVFGAGSFMVVAGFTFLLKRRKTNVGHDALSLFQAFMKTWVAREATELEGIISDHSEKAEVTTKVMRFRTSSGDFFIVLPGVHPGPFHPVGSYDLPGVITREFSDLGPVLTLHRPGGHERNLATSADTLRFARELHDFAKSIEPAEGANARGPSHAQIGRASVSATAFGDDAVVTVSFSPYGSDDLDTNVESVLAKDGMSKGLDINVVDAHNSIRDVQESPDLADSGWTRLLDALAGEAGRPYRAGYAHSKELGFRGKDDLTENGIGLVMFEGERKSVLILADANNAVSGLREEVSKSLAALGYDMVEFCTSDTHNLAARGLTVARGYEALGEETPIPSIVEAVVKLAKLSDGRLAPAAYASGKITSGTRVFGPKSLEEFAKITRESSRFGSTYTKFAAVAVAALLALAVVL